MGWQLSTSATHHNYDDETINPELSELSQELEEVEWFGVPDAPAAAASLSHGMLGHPRSHMADHWSFELALVIAGALMGVALYFWLG